MTRGAASTPADPHGGREDPSLPDTEPSQDLRTRLEAAAQELAPLFAVPVLAAVPELRLCALSELPEGGLLPGDDMTASVAVPLRGVVAVLSFEPSDAQRLLATASPEATGDPLATASPEATGDPLARFTRLALAIIDRLAPVVLGGPLEAGVPRLVEDSVAAALLQTHAPPDTALLSARLVVATEAEACGGVFYLLMDAKRRGGLGPAGTAD